MRISLIVTLFIFCRTSLTFSQVQEIDSYELSQEEILLEAAKSLDKWNYYVRNNLDSLKIDAQHLLMIGIERNNAYAINVGKRSLGSYLVRTGQPAKGIKYLKAANNYFKEKGDKVLETEILNEIGNGYLNDGKPHEAEKYYLKSLNVGKDSPDPTSSFLAESNLAKAYINLGNYDKASALLHHYKNESLKKLKLESVSNAYALLGTIEQEKSNNSLAKEYFRKSAEFGFRSKAKSQIAHAYNNMAIVFFEENDQSKSLEYFKKALEIRLQTKNSKSISESYYNLGGYFTEVKKYDEALKYYTISENFSKEKHLLKEELDAVLAIAEVYKLQHEWEKAIAKMDSYIELQDQYFSELSIEKTEETELLETLDNLEKQSVLERNEKNLLGVIDDQKYYSNLLYVVFGFSAIALLFLAIYKRRIS